MPSITHVQAHHRTKFVVAWQMGGFDSGINRQRAFIPLCGETLTDPTLWGEKNGSQRPRLVSHWSQPLLLLWHPVPYTYNTRYTLPATFVGWSRVRVTWLRYQFFRMGAAIEHSQSTGTRWMVGTDAMWRPSPRPTAMVQLRPPKEAILDLAASTWAPHADGNVHLALADPTKRLTFPSV